MTDLTLAIAHHLLAFGLAGVLAAEFASVRVGMGGAAVRRLGLLDGVYGALAALIIVVGFLRVYYGAKGPVAYLPNPVFWAKIAAFAIVGLISVAPTAKIFAWRRRAKADPAWLTPADEVARMRQWFLAEAVVFAFIPVFAAAMARGMGLPT